MSSLTTDELTVLTKSVNQRLAEFGPDTLGCLSAGVVRLVAEVFVEWQEQSEHAFYDALNRQASLGPSPYTNDSGGLAVVILDEPLKLTEGDALDDDDEEPDDFDDDPKPKRIRPAGKHVPRHRKVEYERKENAGRHGNILPTLDDIIAELRRQAVGTGIMPSIATFDTARPGNWATAGAHMQRLGMSWNDLADAAELRPRPRGGQPVVDVNENE